MKITPDALFSLLSPSKTADSTREERLKSAAEARLRDARTASETLKSRSSDAAEERKAQARQKVEQLKARLSMLRAMAGVDPKGTARLAAQIARELGAAVKAYASAGGNASGMTGVTAPPVSNDSAATAQGAEGAPVDAATAEPVSTETASAEGEDAPTPANPYQQAIDEQKAQASETARRSGELKADTDFMAEVRKMAAELKALVRQATDKTRAGDEGALSPQEAAELDKAVAAMDRDLQQASGDLGGSLVSLLI